MFKIIIFVIIAVSSGWIGLGLDVLFKNDLSQGLGALFFIIVPALTAIIISIKDKKIKNLGFKPNFKANIRWYVFCIIFDMALLLMVFLTGYFGGGFTREPVAALAGAIMGTALISIPSSFIKNILEEISWRGFLSERLTGIMNGNLANVLVGIIWGTWHLPYWLIITPRKTFFEMSPYNNIWLIVVTAYIALINLSFLYNRMRLFTKSIWLSVILHTMNNVFIMSLFTNIAYFGQNKWLFSPGTNGVLYISMLLLVNIFLEINQPISQLLEKNNKKF